VLLLLLLLLLFDCCLTAAAAAAAAAAACTAGGLAGFQTSKGMDGVSPRVPENRVVFNSAMLWELALIGFPVFGYRLAKNDSDGYVVGQIFIGFAAAFYLSAVFGYSMAIKPRSPAAAAAAVHAAMYCFAGVMTYSSVYGVQRMGLGGYFLMLALLQFGVATLILILYIL
jgi:hypothetical protein